VTPPLISVVIPCFRQGHFLAGAIDSALRQSHPSVEVVVVNDGSDDQTDEVARRYGHRIRYVRQANQGLPRARNNGIAVATGKYLLVLDSDDLLHPDALRWLVTAAAGRDDVLCVMGFRGFAEGGQPFPDRFPTDRGDPGALLLRTNLGPPHCYLSPRSMVVRLGGFDAGLRSCEDWDLWVRLVFAGAELVPVDRVGAYYRQHTQSMSRHLITMARTQAEVMSRIYFQVRSDPAPVRRLGVESGELRRVLRCQIAREHSDAGYHLREQGNYSQALRQYALGAWWGGLRAGAVAGICKLLPHRLRRAISTQR